jgi:hypothetical protein
MAMRLIGLVMMMLLWPAPWAMAQTTYPAQVVSSALVSKTVEFAVGKNLVPSTATFKLNSESWCTLIVQAASAVSVSDTTGDAWTNDAPGNGNGIIYFENKNPSSGSHTITVSGTGSPFFIGKGVCVNGVAGDTPNASFTSSSATCNQTAVPSANALTFSAAYYYQDTTGGNTTVTGAGTSGVTANVLTNVYDSTSKLDFASGLIYAFSGSAGFNYALTGGTQCFGGSVTLNP